MATRCFGSGVDPTGVRAYDLARNVGYGERRAFGEFDLNFADREWVTAWRGNEAYVKAYFDLATPAPKPNRSAADIGFKVINQTFGA
jgi:hypothetical protein